MITDEQAKKMLDSISLSGAADESNAASRPVIVGEASRDILVHILNVSSGLPRIRTDVASKFALILNQPVGLAALSNLQIRCCLCRKVITYPAWYHHIKYAVNHFHFFICFDSNSPAKPSTRCYKRG